MKRSIYSLIMVSIITLQLLIISNNNSKAVNYKDDYIEVGVIDEDIIELVTPWPTDMDFYDIEWHPDGSFAYIIGALGTILKFDGENFTDLGHLFPNNNFGGGKAEFSPDGSYTLFFIRRWNSDIIEIYEYEENMELIYTARGYDQSPTVLWASNTSFAYMLIGGKLYSYSARGLINYIPLAIDEKHALTDMDYSNDNETIYLVGEEIGSSRGSAIYRFKDNILTNLSDDINGNNDLIGISWRPGYDYAYVTSMHYLYKFNGNEMIGIGSFLNIGEVYWKNDGEFCFFRQLLNDGEKWVFFSESVIEIQLNPFPRGNLMDMEWIDDDSAYIVGRCGYVVKYNNGEFEIISEYPSYQFDAIWGKISWNPKFDFGLINGNEKLLYFDGVNVSLFQNISGLDISWSPDGLKAIIPSSDDTIYIINSNGIYDVLHTGLTDGYWYSAAWHPRNGQALIGGESGSLIQLNGNNITDISYIIEDHDLSYITKIEYQPYGNEFIICDIYSRAVYINGQETILINDLIGYDESIKDFSINPVNGNMYFIGRFRNNSEYYGIIWEYNGDKMVQIFNASKDNRITTYPTSIEWHPSGDFALIIGAGTNNIDTNHFNEFIKIYDDNTIIAHQFNAFGSLWDFDWSKDGKIGTVVSNGIAIYNYYPANHIPIFSQTIDDITIYEDNYIVGTSPIDLSIHFADDMSLQSANFELIDLDNISVVKGIFSDGKFDIQQCEPNWSGSGNYQIKMTDYYGESILSNQFNIKILPTNDKPQIFSIGNIIIENNEVAISLCEDEIGFYIVNTSDIDGDKISLSINPVYDYIKINEINSSLVFSPKNEDVGYLEVSLIADDGNGSFTSCIMRINIENVNDIPYSNQNNITIVMQEDTVNYDINLSKLFFDDDGDNISYSINKMNNIKAKILDNGTLEIRPEDNYTGDDTIEFIISDSYENLRWIINIVVIPVNDAPYDLKIIADSVYQEGGDQIVSSVAFDVDDEVLNYSWSSNVTGEIGYGQSINLSLPAGFYMITLTVTDAGGLFSSLMIEIEVTSTNDIPNEQDILEDDNDIERCWIIGLLVILIIIFVSIIFIILLFINKKRNGSNEIDNNYEKIGEDEVFTSENIIESELIISQTDEDSNTNTIIEKSQDIQIIQESSLMSDNNLQMDPDTNILENPTDNEIDLNDEIHQEDISNITHGTDPPIDTDDQIS